MGEKSFYFLSFILASSLVLTGCLPSETPATPSTSSSSSGGGSGGGSGGSGGGSGGTGYGSTTDPTSDKSDPALGVSYRYYTGSLNRIGVWDITIPAKADGTEDLTQLVSLSAKLNHMSEFGVDAIVTFDATCGRQGSMGQRTCNVTGTPKCFINKVDGDTSVDSDGYAAFEAANPTYEFLLNNDAISAKTAPTNFCQLGLESNVDFAKGSERFLYNPNVINGSFQINVLNGMALQAQFKGYSQTMSTNSGTVTNSAVETHFGFSSTQSDCTGFPNLATPLFQMTTGGYQLRNQDLATMILISSKSDTSTSFAQVDIGCSSLGSSSNAGSTLDCYKGGNFRNLNYKFSLTSVFDGSSFTSGFTCNSYGLRMAGGIAIVANQYGGVMILVPNQGVIQNFIGVAADRKISTSSLIGTSLYGMKHFDVVTPQVRNVNGGNYFRMYFNPDSATIFGYSPTITSSVGFGFGGNSRTTQVIPLGSKADHAFWDVYSSDTSENYTTDSSIYDKFGTSDVLKESGLYQIYDDASSANSNINSQGIGYLGRLGRHIVGIFTNLDTFGGSSNFLNLSGIFSDLNPAYSTGIPSAAVTGAIWDRSGVISKSNLRVITVSPWFAAQAKSTDRLRIMDGGSTINRGLYTISNITGNQITVTSDLLSNATVDDSSVSYALADGVLDIATQKLKVNCDFAKLFKFAGSGNLFIEKVSIGEIGAMKTYSVDYRTGDCELHLSSLTSDDTSVTLGSSANGVNYGYPQAVTSEIATAGHRFLAANTPYLRMLGGDPLDPRLPEIPIGSLVEVIDDAGTGASNGIYIVSDSIRLQSGWVNNWDGHLVLSRNGVNFQIGNTGARPVFQVLSTASNNDYQGLSINVTSSLMMWEK